MTITTTFAKLFKKEDVKGYLLLPDSPAARASSSGASSFAASILPPPREDVLRFLGDDAVDSSTTTRFLAVYDAIVSGREKAFQNDPNLSKARSDLIDFRIWLKCNPAVPKTAEVTNMIDLMNAAVERLGASIAATKLGGGLPPIFASIAPPSPPSSPTAVSAVLPPSPPPRQSTALTPSFVG